MIAIPNSKTKSTAFNTPATALTTTPKLTKDAKTATIECPATMFTKRRKPRLIGRVKNEKLFL